MANSTTIAGFDEATEARCRAIIAGEAEAETAEELMRSRYAAYALCEVDYILSTHAPEAQDDVDREGIEEWSKSSEWLGLEVVESVGGGKDDETGEVEFIAKFRVQGADQVHHERASFRKHEGKWLFVEGDMVKPKPIVRDAPKVGRNDPCPCGSGKKHKKCCGKA